MITDTRSLLAAVDRLYAAALDPAEWDRFLAVAASMFKADNAYVSQIEHRPRTMSYVSLRRTEDFVPVRNFPAVMDEDPRMPAFRASRARPVHCRMAVSEDQLHASRAYREYLRPRGIEYTMVVGLPARTGVTNFLGVTRGVSGRPFDDTDCEVLAALTPHLDRGFAVREALDQNRPVPVVSSLPAKPDSADAGENLIRQRFALAPAQARLVMLLMQGRSVKEAAETLGITEGSARQYLKLVFRKTGARRQSDLVRVVGQTVAPR
jgi:DNA-binding CsgD family transcriptional regulator